MKITDVRIGDIVADKTLRFPMRVVGIFEDGTLNLDFEGNEGDVFEVYIDDVIRVEDKII